MRLKISLFYIYFSVITTSFYNCNNRSSDINRKNMYTISNPLVLITGASKYDIESLNLRTVDEEMTTFYRLFKEKCGYEVSSTYFNSQGDKIGKNLTLSTFEKFIGVNVKKFNNKKDDYDALIFIFSGHGDGNYVGNDRIIFSNYDGQEKGCKFFSNIISKFTNGNCDKSQKKPKIFFKLACRSNGYFNSEEKIEPCKWDNVLEFYATTPGDTAGVLQGIKIVEKFKNLFLFARENCVSFGHIIEEIMKTFNNKTNCDRIQIRKTLRINDVYFAKNVNDEKEKKINNIINGIEETKFKPGFNLYKKCGLCGCQSWLELGYDKFILSDILYMQNCKNCNKAGDASMLNIIGAGPSRYIYYFIARDEDKKQHVLSDSGEIKNGKLSFNFLLKYPSFSYAHMVFEKIN